MQLDPPQFYSACRCDKDRDSAGILPAGRERRLIAVGKHSKKQGASQQQPQADPAQRQKRWNAGLLVFALLGALCIYWPVLQAGWFYDDSDYVLNDPRLNH